MTTLNHRIGGLPQELQDIIFGFTLLAMAEIPTSGAVNISNTYKPPLSFQIHRRSRAKFAKWYYSNCTFHTSSFAGLRRRIRWLHILQSQHLDMITTIEYSSRLYEDAFDTHEQFWDIRNWRNSRFAPGQESKITEKINVRYGIADAVSKCKVERIVPLTTNLGDARMVLKGLAL